MATDTSDVLKQCYLKIKSKNVGVWQKRWIVLRKSSSKGPYRLEKFLDEKHARNNFNAKYTLLSSLCTITRHNQKKHSFSLNFQDGTSRMFSCDSDLEADTWVKLIMQECVMPTTNLTSGEPDVISPGIQKEVQELHHVCLQANSKLEGIYGEVLLQVTHEHIYLYDKINPKIRQAAWPLTSLRRYGSDCSKFTFESGRHCDTGEGLFVFFTCEGEKIYRSVHNATLQIARNFNKNKSIITNVNLITCQPRTQI